MERVNCGPQDSKVGGARGVVSKIITAVCLFSLPVEFGIIVDTEEGLKEKEIACHKAETGGSKQR